MTIIPILVLLIMIPLTIWAWRRKPGIQAQEEFIAMWQIGPWGKQVIADFYALEVMLALWIISHAAVHGSWLLAVLCIITMPVFGAIPAAIYWLLSLA